MSILTKTFLYKLKNLTFILQNSCRCTRTSFSLDATCAYIKDKKDKAPPPSPIADTKHLKNAASTRGKLQDEDNCASKKASP